MVLVDNVKKAAACLAAAGLKEVQSAPNGEVRIYDDCDIASTVAALAKDGIKILSIRSNDESVEDYYLDLVKGR